MTEEAAAVPPAAKATNGKGKKAAPSNGEHAATAADGGGGDKGKRKFNNKRDETPIEELFDLSQPIPKVDKPDKNEFDKTLAELTAAIDALKEERKKIQDTIDSAMSDPVSRAQLQEARNKMNALKTKKNVLIEEKKTLRNQMDQAKNKTDKIIKDKKDARSNVKYNTVQEIDQEIKKLQRKQETTTMSLQDEKRLIKEIDSLEASKKFVADLKNKDAAMDDIKEQRKSISQLIAAKDKEIDVFTKEIDEIMNAIKEINDKETSKRNSIQELFKTRNDTAKLMTDKIKEKDTLRNEFRKKNDAFFNYQRAVRAQKKEQYDKEKAERDKEKAEWDAKVAAEEAKKIPYEEEQHLCEFLADYLERTYLGKTDKKDSADGVKKDDVVAVTEDPFAGAQPLKKKDDEAYFGKGKEKKKRVRAAKKQDSAAGPFTLSVDSFEQFGLLQLNPPTKIEDVEATVVALREKKEWYSKQPRGSVPTAQEIRKANEKNAQKVRQAVSKETAAASAAVADVKKKGAAFSLKNDDFAPLAATSSPDGANGSSASSWGQKPTASTVSPEA